MIVIAGAGLSGMACAARLAARGLPVTILEAADEAGGIARIVRNGRFAFDVGPTSLTLPAVYRDLFLQTGAPLEESVGIEELDDAFRFEFPGGPVLRLPGGGVGRWAQEIGEALGPAAGEQWREFTAVGASIWAAARPAFLEAPASALTTGWRDLRRMRAVLPRRTLRDVTKATMRDRRLRQLAEHQCVLMGTDPRRAPAALAAVPYLTQTFGTHHIRGGVGMLAQALRERCESLGVAFEFGSRVTRVVGDGSVRGVELDGDQYVAADAVVWAADRRDAGERTWSQFTVLQALTGVTVGLSHHNVWFTDAPDDEVDSLRRGEVFDSPTLYVCEPDDEQMRPADSAARRIAVPAARHDVVTGTNWRSAAGTYAHDLTTQLAARGHSSGERVMWQHTISPADVGDITGTHDGAIAGSQYLGLSSALARKDTGSLHGEYRVGSSAHPGPGVPLAGMGARTVAAMVAAQVASST